MSIYQKNGNIPHKRHIVFRQPSGALYHEELFGTEGFSSTSSLVYHLYPPTMVKEIGEPINMRPKAAIEDNLKCLSFMGYDVAPTDDYLQSRKVFLFNDDMQIGMACPTQSMHDYFFKNSDADEMLFVHKGSG
jgi:homogentisate 1,2-dioxygenase